CPGRWRKWRVPVIPVPNGRVSRIAPAKPWPNRVCGSPGPNGAREPDSGPGRLMSVLMRCATSALAIARIDGSDLRAHVGEVDDAGDEGDDVEEDHAHAHRRQCEKGECESDAEEDDPELLALLVH